ncbi:MAG TPA: ChaB family protein [Thermoanaerobaculia bacterium]|nr:ChaB family protein [Thermoanaerobaculia bacterium]
MYESIDDLPIVCRLHLPTSALRVYRDAFNRAWKDAPDGKSRHHVAQTRAWSEVRERFERDKVTGRWVRKRHGR